MIPTFVRRQYGWVGARLFRKYVLIISSLVFGALLVSGGLDIFFTYQDKLDNVSNLEREKAALVASHINLFLEDVQRQLEQAAQTEYEDSAAGMALRELDYMSLVHRTAISELGYWGSDGRQQIALAEFGPETLLFDSPLSAEQIVSETKAAGTFNGPVYFDNDSVQHITMGIAETGTGKGVLVANVNLSVVQIIISQLSLANSGWAYVVDSEGKIVSHSVDELATRRADVSICLRWRRQSTPEQSSPARPPAPPLPSSKVWTVKPFSPPALQSRAWAGMWW